MALYGPICILTDKSMLKMKTHPDPRGLFRERYSHIFAIGASISGFPGTPKSGHFTGFSGRGSGESGTDTGFVYPWWGWIKGLPVRLTADRGMFKCAEDGSRTGVLFSECCEEFPGQLSQFEGEGRHEVFK